MIQEILDEVLDTSLQPDVNPRYTLKDNVGNVINDNVQIELKTPVVTGGTPLNRATFANLQGDLYTQDRYNVPNISYELMGIGLIEGDIIPKTWVKETDTKYNAEGITLRSSSTPSETYALNKACDGDEGSYFSGANDISEDFCRIRFDEPKKITKMHVNIKSTNHMNSDYQSVKIQGSKDLSSWIDLYNVPLSSNMIYSEDVVLQNVDYYKYYRIFATLNHNSLKVAEWGVVEYEGEIYDYVFNLDLPLTSYEPGKIVNLQATAFEEVTSFDNPYININQLGAIQILGQIRAGKYYNLVFDGAVWLPQVTNIGVGSEPIVITESGTYEVDPDVRYKVIAVGGGGGACIGYSRHYSEYAGVNGGGAGGIIEDILIPESTTVNVTIGAASGNKKFLGDYSAGTGTTPKAGDTTIGKFTAYGGYGGSNEENVETSGVGGSYTGGVGRNGESANNTTYYGNGGNGLTINGVEYGAGGSYGYDWSHDLTLNEPATNGIVILYPLV